MDSDVSLRDCFVEKYSILPAYFQHRPVMTNFSNANPVVMATDLILPNDSYSKVHGANMGPNWGRQDPGGSHVGPMNLAFWGTMQSLAVEMSPRSTHSMSFNFRCEYKRSGQSHYLKIHAIHSDIMSQRNRIRNENINKKMH